MVEAQQNKSIHQNTNRNLFWSGGSFALTAILNFGALYVLTHYLGPDEMAIVFIGIIFQDLALLFMDSGMGSYVIQAEGLTQREYASLFYQALLLSCVLMLLLTGSAPFLASFFHSPPLQQALTITAFSFIPIALSFPQKQRLQREHHFKQIALAEFIGMLLAALVTIVMAINGQGFASYLVGFIVRKLGEAAVMWQKEPWFPKPTLLPEQAKKLFHYSFFASNALILSYATRLIDTMIIGRVLGTYVLGLYSLASNIVFFPVTKCVVSFSRVFIVNFSHSKGNITALREAFLEGLVKLSALLLPALSALVILIPNILNVFFKPAWLPMAPLVQIMALYGLIVAFLRLGEPLLLALAKVRSVFVIYTVNIILTALFLLGLIQYGAIGAAWAVLLAGLLPCWLMYRSLNILKVAFMGEMLQRLRPILLLTSVAILILYLIQLIPGLGDIAILAISTPLMLLLYTSLWKLLRSSKKTP